MKVRKIPDTINSFQQGINTRANLLMLMPPHSEGAQRSVYLAGFLFLMIQRRVILKVCCFCIWLQQWLENWPITLYVRHWEQGPPFKCKKWIKNKKIIVHLSYSLVAHVNLSYHTLCLIYVHLIKVYLLKYVSKGCTTNQIHHSQAFLC